MHPTIQRMRTAACRAIATTQHCSLKPWRPMKIAMRRRSTATLAACILVAIAVAALCLDPVSAYELTAAESTQ